MKKSWGKISKKFGEKSKEKNAKFRENPVKNIKIREISRKIEKKFGEKYWKKFKWDILGDFQTQCVTRCQRLAV